MSKKAIIISIIAVLIGILAISAVFVLTDGKDRTGPEGITLDEAVEIGSEFLMSTYLLPEADTYSAELDGSAYRVYNIPGTEILDDNGVIQGFDGGTWYVYVSADNGDILTFGHTDNLN